MRVNWNKDLKSIFKFEYKDVERPNIIREIWLNNSLLSLDNGYELNISL